MTFRDNVTLAAFAIRAAGVVAGLMIGMLAQSPGTALTLSALWLLNSGWVLRHHVLPRILPAVTCPGCHRTFSLTARWKCGVHYVDHCEQHVLSFVCEEGHRIESFPCPRCKSTILIQYGNPKRLRRGSAIRLRPPLLASSREGNGFVVGTDEQGRPVTVAQERLNHHMAICGGTGRGKSTLLSHLVKHLMDHGEGVTVLDPGGDLARLIYGHVPAERRRDVIYIDPTMRPPFELNILSPADAREADMLCEEVCELFHRLHRDSWGPLLSHQLSQAIRAIMHVGGTLIDVRAMFLNDQRRASIVRDLPQGELREFWTQEFPRIPAMRHVSVTNKLGPIVGHHLLRPILCARRSQFAADTYIRRRKIVLVNLATGSPTDPASTLLGLTIVQRILAAAFRQARVEPSLRVPHTLVIDEFQRFTGRATLADQMLAEARKYRLRLVLANQFIEQLPTPVRSAIFGNVGVLASFRVGHRDARVLLPEFTGAQLPDLMELKRGECLLRLDTDWTHIRTPPPLPLLDVLPAPVNPVDATANGHRVRVLPPRRLPTPDRPARQTAPPPVAPGSEFVT